jgi:hypothetical protein
VSSRSSSVVPLLVGRRSRLAPRARSVGMRPHVRSPARAVPSERDVLRMSRCPTHPHRERHSDPHSTEPSVGTPELAVSPTRVAAPTPTTSCARSGNPNSVRGPLHARWQLERRQVDRTRRARVHARSRARGRTRGLRAHERESLEGTQDRRGRRDEVLLERLLELRQCMVLVVAWRRSDACSDSSALVSTLASRRRGMVVLVIGGVTRDGRRG